MEVKDLRKLKIEGEEFMLIPLNDGDRLLGIFEVAKLLKYSKIGFSTKHKNLLSQPRDFKGDLLTEDYTGRPRFLKSEVIENYLRETTAIFEED